MCQNCHLNLFTCTWLEIHRGLQIYDLQSVQKLYVHCNVAAWQQSSVIIVSMQF